MRILPVLHAKRAFFDILGVTSTNVFLPSSHVLDAFSLFAYNAYHIVFTIVHAVLIKLVFNFN